MGMYRVATAMRTITSRSSSSSSSTKSACRPAQARLRTAATAGWADIAVPGLVMLAGSAVRPVSSFHTAATAGWADIAVWPCDARWFRGAARPAARVLVSPCRDCRMRRARAPPATPHPLRGSQCRPQAVPCCLSATRCDGDHTQLLGHGRRGAFAYDTCRRGARGFGVACPPPCSRSLEQGGR